MNNPINPDKDSCSSNTEGQTPCETTYNPSEPLDLDNMPPNFTGSFSDTEYNFTFLNGLFHRFDGPAVETQDSCLTKRFLHGMRIPKAIFVEFTKNIAEDDIKHLIFESNTQKISDIPESFTGVVKFPGLVEMLFKDGRILHVDGDHTCEHCLEKCDCYIEDWDEVLELGTEIKNRNRSNDDIEECGSDHSCDEECTEYCDEPDCCSIDEDEEDCDELGCDIEESECSSHSSCS